ncbi:hypothetical protein [Salinicoccus bachuensis]|uniref:DUF4025 domain-containing protein n=1 Tax=Salinicoccus bachuensis TaxID=3136731 RepID=A0ABZ3CFX2_9STAP
MMTMDKRGSQNVDVDRMINEGGGGFLHYFDDEHHEIETPQPDDTDDAVSHPEENEASPEYKEAG